MLNVANIFTGTYINISRCRHIFGRPPRQTAYLRPGVDARLLSGVKQPQEYYGYSREHPHYWRMLCTHCSREVGGGPPGGSDPQKVETPSVIKSVGKHEQLYFFKQLITFGIKIQIIYGLDPFFQSPSQCCAHKHLLTFLTLQYIISESCLYHVHD